MQESGKCSSGIGPSLGRALAFASPARGGGPGPASGPSGSFVDSPDRDGVAAFINDDDNDDDDGDDDDDNNTPGVRGPRLPLVRKS